MFVPTCRKSKNITILRSEAWMADIAAWEPGRESCYILSEPVDYGLAETLTLPFKTGGSIGGTCGGQYVPPNHALRGLLSALVWHGNKHSPAIQLCGVEQLVERLTILGAPIGVLLHKPAAGLGTGKVSLRDLWLSECDVGVQCGYVEEEHNCDCTVLDRVFFHGCIKSCVKLVNTQSMGHTVSGCWFLSTGADCFTVEGGGNLWVAASTVAKAERLLHLTGRRAIGSNNASYVFEQIKIDDHAGPKCELVRMEQEGSCNIVFRDCHVGCDDYAKEDGRMFVVRGGTALTVDNFYNLQPRTVEWHYKRRRGPDDMPNLFFNRSRIYGAESPTDILSTATSAGPAHVVIRDCYSGNGVPLDDYTGVVQGKLN